MQVTATGRSTSVEDFTELFVGHYEPLLRMAALLVGSRTAAEDVVQEAYIRMHGRLRRDGVDDPVAYLRQVVLNLARSDLRRRLVALRHAPKPDPAPAGPQAATMPP